MPQMAIAGHDVVGESPWKEECGVAGIFDTTETDAAPRNRVRMPMTPSV